MCLPRIQDVAYFGDRNHKHNARETKPKHVFVCLIGDRRPGRLGMLQDIITNKGPGIYVASSHSGRAIRPSERPTRVQCTRHTETLEYENRHQYKGDLKDDFPTVGWTTPSRARDGFSMVHDFATRRYRQPCVNGPSAPDYGPMGRRNNDAMQVELVPEFRANRDLQLDGPRHMDSRYSYHGMVPESRANLDFHFTGARHMDPGGADQWEHPVHWEGEGDFWYPKNDDEDYYEYLERV